MSDLVTKIVAAFEQVAAKKVPEACVNEYKFNAATKGDNQFVFFLKPESTATYAGVKIDAILQATLKLLEDAKVTVGAVRVLGGDYLNEKNIIGEHYGVISNISRNGLAVVTDDAKAQLESVFGADIKAGAIVVGAHQLLDKEKSLTPASLRVLNDNLGTKRLGPGTYAFKLNVFGKNYIVLNPFHPYQLVPFTTSGHAIVVIEGISKTSWKSLRNDVCGATDPEAAAVGSIRRTLLDKKADFGLAEVNKSNNGCHMSAGPLEALVELRRFFQIKTEETAFGTLLLEKAVTAARIEELGNNVDITVGGKAKSSFDATEEFDSAEALAVLAPQ